ncbi:dipeptidase [Cobetia crustatorum]|uniref:Dipeptidase n=1 Tax=Cobetia crustatorum TaxID=553385 RepID=A0A558HM00_9GAMM|nr:dipeptidase [Cobetia crustatorum]TVU70145.1 dipeptidase [Cobetia crustatorum]
MSISTRVTSRQTALALGLALGLGTALPAIAAETSTPPGEHTLKSDQLVSLIAQNQEKLAEDFNGFLKQVAERNHEDTAVTSAIEQYLAGETLEGDDFVNIYRLLGVYNRLQYGDDVEALLKEMVAMPTFKVGEKPQHENPEIARFGELIKSKAEEFGLTFRNVDNRIFEVELKGTGDDVFGILTHGDVVPAGEEGWTLEDGTHLNPFDMTLIDGKLYGRGTEDDKGSIAAALYAMKSLKENDVPVKRTIRLMIETTEETGGEGFEYYKAKNTLPEYNIVLDSGYPAITAENGFGTIDARFPLTRAGSDDTAKDGLPAITDFKGGLATNQIPERSVATLHASDAEGAKALSSKLKTLSTRYVDTHGKDFSVANEVKGEDVIITVTGKSAHSSSPADGINPVTRLAGLLATSDIDFQDNAYEDAVHYLNDNYGLDYHGKLLGVAYSHDFMGPLKVTPTYLEREDAALRVAVNVRAPAGDKSPEELSKTIQDKLSAYAKEQGMDMALNVEIRDWMLRDPSGAWLKTLLNIFGDTTGMDAKPRSSAGSTTAKLLPNAINFGPSMPGETYTGHTSGEFKRVDNLMLDIQMFTEMMARIGNQDSLD